MPSELWKKGSKEEKEEGKTYQIPIRGFQLVS